MIKNSRYFLLIQSKNKKPLLLVIIQRVGAFCDLKRSVKYKIFILLLKTLLFFETLER